MGKEPTYIAASYAEIRWSEHVGGRGVEGFKKVLVAAIFSLNFSARVRSIAICACIKRGVGEQ